MTVRKSHLLQVLDPMSSDALASVESEITIKLAELSTAVAEDNSDGASMLACELIILIGNRNKTCKLLKCE